MEERGSDSSFSLSILSRVTGPDILSPSFLSRLLLVEDNDEVFCLVFLFKIGGHRKSLLSLLLKECAFGNGTISPLLKKEKTSSNQYQESGGERQERRDGRRGRLLFRRERACLLLVGKQQPQQEQLNF